MKISRQVGTVSEKLNIFIQDATVSTGAGLANVSSATVSYTIYRSDMTALSTGTCSTSSGALGLYFASTLVQLSSTQALGWYQFHVPNLAFAAGTSAILHMYGATNMAPVPIEIDLSTNATVLTPVGVSSVTTLLGVSTLTTPVGVSSTTVLHGVSTLTIPVGVSSVATLVGVSTLTIPVGVSTGVVGISSATIPLGVSSISTPVTASSLTRLAGVSSLSAAALANFFNTGSGVFFSTAVVSSVAYEIATNATVGGNVGVSSISIPVSVSSVTDKAGYGVSSISVGVNASTVGDKTGYSLTTGEYASIADKFLGRNVSSGGDGGRTVSEALYVLRNKVDATAGIVYATDDTTSSWAFTVSTLAGDPIVSIDPA